MLLGPQRPVYSPPEFDHYWKHPLPKGVKIDTRDRAMVEQLRWIISPNGHVVNVADGQRLELRLARLIMIARHDQLVRHVNGDLLDCRRENLIVERVL